MGVLIMTAVAAQEFVHDQKDYIIPYQASVDSLLSIRKGVSVAAFQKSLMAPRYDQRVVLQKAQRKELSAHDVYKRGKAATVIVGHAFLCRHCDKTHLYNSSGYIIDKGGLVVTNYHVAEGYMDEETGNTTVGLFVRLADGRTFMVKGVAFASRKDDLAVLELDLAEAPANLPALLLAKGIEIGERVYALGHPRGMHYYLTEGIVAFKKRTDTNDPGHEYERDVLMISADYAAGSSGGPILDRFGNVVATVSSTETILYKNQPEKVQMVLKYTIPVESLNKLIGKG